MAVHWATHFAILSLIGWGASADSSDRASVPSPVLAGETWPIVNAGHRPPKPPTPIGPTATPAVSPQVQSQRLADGLPAMSAPSPPHNRRDAPETLSDAWRIALTADGKLHAKRSAVSSAQHTLRATQAERWPTIDLSTSYTVRTDEPAFRFDIGELPLTQSVFPYSQDESFALRSQIRLPLFTSGRVRHAVSAATDQVGAATWGLNKAVMDLKLRVACQYIDVLRAQRDVEVAEITIKSLEAHQRDIEAHFRHRWAARHDLLAAQVSLSDARQKLIQARNKSDLSWAAYNRSLGRPLTAPVHIAELPPETVTEDAESLTGLAMRLRPDLKRLAAEVQALEWQAKSRRASDLPQIELLGEYTFEENRFASPEGIAAAGVGVTWNVFDAGRDRHNAAALLDEAEGLRRLLADLRSIVALEIRQAWLNVYQTRERLNVTSKALQQADENLRVWRERYRAGLATSSEVLDAETLRTQAYRNHYSATYDAVLAVIGLRHATGQL